MLFTPSVACLLLIRFRCVDSLFVCTYVSIDLFWCVFSFLKGELAGAERNIIIAGDQKTFEDQLEHAQQELGKSPKNMVS